MSPNVSQSSKSRFKRLIEAGDLDSKIDGPRQPITTLHGKLSALGQRRREFDHRSALKTPLAISVTTRAQSRQANWRWLIAVVVSLFLVYGGQYILLGTQRGALDEGLRQAIAGGMLIAGALMFGAFMPRVLSSLPRLEIPVHAANSTKFVWRNPWTLGWSSAALGLAALAIILFIARGESPIVISLWLASILAMIISQIRGWQIKRPHTGTREHIYVIALIGLLLITLITRVYHLTTLPYNFDGDFASVGLEARALITGQRPIFSYGWGSIPLLGYLPAGLTISIFGDNLAGLNASGVIEGLLVIVGVYLLGRDLFHVRVGLIAAALLTISYTHMAASRQSVYLDPVVVLVFAIYFLLVGLREGRGGPLVASGMLTAICALVYYPGRIAALIVSFILIYLLLFRRNWFQARWWMILIWVLAVFITLGPMLVVFGNDLDAFIGRGRTSFILNPEMIKHVQGGYRVETVSDMLLQHARRTALMFHYYADTGTQFGFRRPFLDSLTAPLFTLGMGYALFHLRRFGHVMLIAWTVLVVFTGSFLMGDSPNWPRLMILLPPTALLAANAVNVIYGLAEGSLERVGNWSWAITPAAVMLFLLLVGVRNWNTYIDMKGTYATPLTRISRYLADQPPSTRAYLISEGYTPQVREFEFLIPGRLVANLAPENIGSDIPPVGTPTLLILTAEQGELIPRLQQHFPNGSVETHAGNSPGEIAFYVFRLPQ